MHISEDGGICMPFVAAACENCGGPLRYDAVLKKWNCEHCGYINEKENPIQIVTASIDDFHLKGMQFDTPMTVEMKMKLNAAEAALTLGKYKDAEYRFRRLSDEIPQEYRVWWGQIRARTKELTAEVNHNRELDKLCALYDSMMHFVPTTERDELEQRFMAYIQLQEERLRQRIDALEQREKDLHRNYESVQEDLAMWRRASYDRSEQSFKIMGAILAAGLVLGVLGQSLLLILAAVGGIGYYYLVLEPNSKKNEAEWACEKQKQIQMLTRQSQSIEQELQTVAGKLRKLRN